MNGKRSSRPAFFAAALSALFCSCDPAADSGGRTVPDLSRAVYIVNNLAETVSVYDPDSGAMHDDAIVVGQVPNDIKYWDGRFFVVDSMDNDVRVYGETDYSLLKTVHLGVNRNPYSLIVDADRGRLFVPNFLAGTVSVIDLSTYGVLKEIDVGTGPEGGCYLDGKVYVANTGYYDSSWGEGSVSVIDAETLSVLSLVSIGVGTNPQTILPVPSRSQVHVVCSGNNVSDTEDDDGTIVILDTSSYAVVSELEIGGSPLVSADGFDSASGRVYLAGAGGVMAYLASASPSIEHDYSDFFYDADGLVPAAAYDAADGLVYALDFRASRLLIIDSSGSLVRSVSTGDGPIALALFTK